MNIVVNPQEFVPEKMPEMQKKSSRNFLFIELGLVEFSGVLGILVIIFFTLNYFNILRLSSFPVFSSLPHIIKREPSVSTALILDRLHSYITSSIQPKFLPEGGVDKLTISKNPLGFETKWFSKESSTNFTAVATYNDSQTHLQMLRITTSITSLTSSASTQTAEKIIDSYFLPIQQSDWSCFVSPQQVLCNRITTNNQGMFGYSIINLDATKSATLLISCLIPQESSLITKATSCVSEGI